MAVAKLGQKREALAVSIANVELNWKMTPEMVQASKTYADHMLHLKQMKTVPTSRRSSTQRSRTSWRRA